MGCASCPRRSGRRPGIGALPRETGPAARRGATTVSVADAGLSCQSSGSAALARVGAPTVWARDVGAAVDQPPPRVALTLLAAVPPQVPTAVDSVPELSASTARPWRLGNTGIVPAFNGDRFDLGAPGGLDVVTAALASVRSPSIRSER